ncbi:MAG: hypothetical protein WBW04_15995 [Nitrolancea sp.]
MARPGRSILIIAGSVVALVVAAIAVVLVVSPGETHFTPGSPEDVFQRYLTSYADRDFTTSYGYFTAESQKQLSIDDYLTYARSDYGSPVAQNSRVLVNGVEGDETSKTLHLTIESQSGTGLDINRWSYEVSVPMAMESGSWKIDQLLLGTSPAPLKPLVP